MKRAFLLAGVIVISLFYLASGVLAADGFGQNTTGGAGGTVVTVDSNAADFKAYVETVGTKYIVQVSGTIDLNSVEDGKVSIQSNKTIRGIGESPTIIGSLAFKKGCSNVIIERLNITAPTSDYGEGDGISVKEEITNVFITKCTLYDCWDGFIDIARKSDWVTVSWCKLYFTTPDNGNNNRVSLVGNTESSGDEGTLHVTFHHNWFGSYCIQRIPSVRYGRAHVYNNYYNFSDNLYCVRTRLYAECLVENNYFINVQNPWERYVTSGDPGLLYAAGNALENVTWNVWTSGVVLIDGNDTVFDPNYSYTLDDAEDVPAIVQNGAGFDGNDTLPPHWLFGPYGDFDRSDIVDMNDLGQFVDYWLDTNDINDADYDEDGIVNFYEFALFAGNWLYVPPEPPDTTPPAAPTNLTTSDGDETVSLDWDDNGEPDVNGYNVYRSTIYDSGYAKLNSPLLTDSNYIDNTVTNSTVYFYYVTASDTSLNESGGSSKVSALPLDSNTIVIQEIESGFGSGFCDINGIVDTGEHPGYTGYGYCDTTNATGDGINWSVNITSAGLYTFKWRYANGATDRPADLIINSTTEASGISFPATGSFNNWSEVSVADVNLGTGTKNVRLEATTSNGLANIDYIMVPGPGVEVASCP